MLVVMCRGLHNAFILLLIAFSQSSCVLTGWLEQSIFESEDARHELTEAIGDYAGFYLGTEVVNGQTKHVIATRGLLRQPGLELVLYLAQDRSEPNLVREAPDSQHEGRPPVAIEFMGRKIEYRPTRETSHPSRPLWVRLSSSNFNALNAQSIVGGKRLGGYIDLTNLSYRARSRIVVGLKKSLYIITVPIDLVAFPVVFPIVMIVLHSQDGPLF